jgi:multiple sugar transport system substrate-binding protein/putative aldouronate transport system substrate-binding protein
MEVIMKKNFLCVTSLIVIFSMVINGCSGTFAGNDTEECPYKDFIVVDVFDALANIQGIQSGWFGEIVKKKFNMELNIIAPNEASGGDTLFELRTASGNVGDLIISTAENGYLQDLVDEGLVIDMSKFLENKDILVRYGKAISLLNDKLTQDGIYAIPSEISTLPPNESSEGLELTFGPYLRWDLYAAIGYPKISTLEDLLPVLKQMQSIMPNTESGNPTYAFSFFSNWDGNMMNAAKQPACLYGYDEIGFVLAKADGSDYQSILDENSLYMRILKLYFDANQQGLVDPDSRVQSYPDLFEKYKDGAILYSPWSFLGPSAYNTPENKAEGKGYMLAPIDDMQIFSYGCNNEGNQKTVISIGSKAEDPARLADFIDWLYSPEGIQISCSNTGATAGPQGLTWEMGTDGPYLTEFGEEALLGGDAKVPEEWGGGSYTEGVSQLNYKPVSTVDLDPNGYPYYFTLWKSVLEKEDSALDLNWKNFMGADSTHEYLEKNNQIIVAPGCGYITPDMSSEIATMRNQCRSIIVSYSWKMVFASNDASFYTLAEEMRGKAEALGYDAVLAEDLKNAIAQNTARKEAVTAAGK